MQILFPRIPLLHPHVEARGVQVASPPCTLTHPSLACFSLSHPEPARPMLPNYHLLHLQVWETRANKQPQRYTFLAMPSFCGGRCDPESSVSLLPTGIQIIAVSDAHVKLSRNACAACSHTQYVIWHPRPLCRMHRRGKRKIVLLPVHEIESLKCFA